VQEERIMMQEELVLLPVPKVFF